MMSEFSYILPAIIVIQILAVLARRIETKKRLQRLDRQVSTLLDNFGLPSELPGSKKHISFNELLHHVETGLRTTSRHVGMHPGFRLSTLDCRIKQIEHLEQQLDKLLLRMPTWNRSMRTNDA